MAMQALGHPGLLMTIVDFDRFSEYNGGRCMFPYMDIGRNKAVSLISQLNRYFGMNVNGVYKPLKEYRANIIITAVDRLDVRVEVSKRAREMAKERHNAHEDQFHLWLDLGNGKDYGQAVLGGSGLQNACEILKLTEIDQQEEDQQPSCSTAEALQKQDLMINDQIALMGVNLLWEVFRRGHLKHNAVYYNHADWTMRPGGLHLSPQDELPEKDDD